MNKFNLTFSGEILAGHEPEKVKLRFSKKFSIEDPERLERFFSGQSIILRRNLERKEAAQYFQDLRKLGVVVELVKVTSQEESSAKSKSSAPANQTPANKASAINIPVGNGGSGAGSNSPPATDPLPQPTPPTHDKTPLVPESSLAAMPDAAAQLKARKQELQRQATRELAKQEELPGMGKPKPAERRADAEGATIQKKSVKSVAKGKTIEQAAKRKAQRAQKKAERARQKAEEAASQNVLKEEATLKAEAEHKHREVEEAARRQVALEEAKQRAEEERKRKEAQDAARQQAALEEQQRQADAQRKLREAEEAARKQAELEDQKRREEEDRKRREAEEAARRKAELEEKIRLAEQERKRQEAAEAARHQAELEEQKRQEEEDRKRREAEEAARRQAELKEQQRRAEEARKLREAEEAARRRAEIEEQKRRAEEERKRQEAEEAARQKAEEAARHLAELEAQQLREKLEEQKRREALEAAALQAALEQSRRLEAEEAARLQAELDEIAREEAEEEARVRAELEEKERQAAVAAQRIHLSAQQKKAEAERKSAERRRAISQTASGVTTASVISPPEPTEVPAPARLMQQPGTKARVKTNLDLPRRQYQSTASATATVRKRQVGEPNLYTLRPFRITPVVRARAELAKKRMRLSLTIGSIALAVCLVLIGSFLRVSPAPMPLASRGVAIDAQGAPTLLAGDALLLHDRAGIGTGTKPLSGLGLSTLEAPLYFDGGGNLIALGRLLSEDNAATNEAPLQLLVCAMTESACRAFSSELADIQISNFAVNPLNNNIIIADSVAGEILKLDASGKILARASVPVPHNPVLQLHAGLLLMNSSEGPAISVYRYENNAFGKQLDEVLLLPPMAVEAEQSEVGEFIFSAGAWWVSLTNVVSGSVGVYRFDAQWNSLGKIELPMSSGPLQLINWGEKTLVNDLRNVALQRFNAQGAREVPLVSAPLEAMIEEQQTSVRLQALAWRIAMALCAFTAISGLFYSYLQSRRALVYKPQRERGAHPIDDHADTLQWVEPVGSRQNLLRRTGISYGVLSLALLMLAMSQSLNALPLAALILWLSGPAITLVLLGRASPGNIAVLDEKLLLVDHRGVYHFGSGSSIQYRGPFLLLDDVVVFSGNRLLPAFAPDQLRHLVVPLAAHGVRVDRTTLMVKLLEAKHPLAQGALIVTTATVLMLMLAAQGLL